MLLRNKNSDWAKEDEKMSLAKTAKYFKNDYKI
jgi:hypothetical protein